MFSRRSQAFAAFVLAFAIAVLSIGTQSRGLAHLSSEGRQSSNLQSSNVDRTRSLTFANQADSVLPGEAAGDDPHPKDGAHFTIYRNDEGEIVCRAATNEEIRQRQFDAERLGLRQINHLERGEAKEPKSEQANSGLTIILRATSQLQQNPTAQQAFVKAAANWEALIMSPITIYMDVDYGPTLFGQPWPAGAIGATSTPRRGHPYQSVRTNMIAESDGEANATKQAIFNALPSTTVPTDLGDSSSTTVADSTARALGLLPATAQSTDPAARIGFNSSFTFDFDPSDGIAAGQTDFDAVATHEIGHALGFNSGAGSNLPRPAVWDLYRFRTGATTGTFSTAQRVLTIGGNPDPLQFFFAPGNSELGLSTGGPSGSTTNGGDGWQSSHWKHVSGCAGYIGLMAPAIPSGCRRTISSNDLLAASVLGYNLTNNNAPPPAPPPPLPPPNDNFLNAEIISGCSGSTMGLSFGATSEAGEPSHDPPDSSALSPGHSVWYRWQAPSSASITLTTAGSDFDTIVAVYTGDAVGSLTRVAFNDDVQAGLVTSSITFSPIAGFTYSIAVDGWGGDHGAVRLNWNACPPPSCPGTLIVNDIGDAPDSTPGDGVCSTSAGPCTLRAAIQEANSRSVCATIDLNLSSVAGQIVLNTALPDLNHSVNVIGPGANQLTIMRSTGSTPNFRIFNIPAGVANTIAGVTVSNGNLTFGSNGAGILNSGILTLTGTIISGNTTVSGCAVFNNETGSLTITNSRVSSNSGGGIGNIGTVNLISSTVSANSNTTGGAGIISRGKLNVTGSTVSSNTTGLDGGGILNNPGGVATLINSTVSDNTANQAAGGGISNAGTFSMINSTVSGNSAIGGGGIFNFDGTISLTNSTVTGNTAQNGGGINTRLQTVSIKNTLIANNAASGVGPDVLGSVISQDYNLIGNASSASFTGTTTHDLVNVNPMLGPLANNGGPTMTHAPLAGSPAINAGSNALAIDQTGNPLMTDQRGTGFARIVNNTVDIGAFEFVPAPVLFTDTTNHVIAMDSVTFVRDPFSAGGTYNFSSDRRTRVMIFTSNLGVTQPAPDLAVTAGGIPLTVEAVGPLAGVPDMSYVIVRLDPTLVGQVQLTVTFRGVTSNAGLLSITP